MAFQSSVNQFQGFGVPGDLFNEGPVRSKPYIIDSADPAYNVMGRAFTVTSEGVAAAGGTGAFAGILIGPKEQAMVGTSSGTLAPTLTIPDNTVGELLDMGEVIVSLPAAAAIGDKVAYDTTTGALSTVAPVATFTAAQSTTTLTVSAITGGVLGVGSVVTQASGSQSTVRQIGSALGIAVLGTVLFTSTQSSIETRVYNLESLSVIEAPIRQELAKTIAKPVADSAGAALESIPNYLTSQGVPELIAYDVKLAAADGFTDGMKAIDEFLASIKKQQTVAQMLKRRLSEVRYQLNRQFEFESSERAKHLPDWKAQKRRADR